MILKCCKIFSNIFQSVKEIIIPNASVSRILGHDSGVRSLFLENALKDVFALLVCVVYMYFSPQTAGTSLKKHYNGSVFKIIYRL